MGPHAVRYPYPPLAGRIARDAAIVWVLLRLVLLAVSGVVLLHVAAALVVVGVTGTLVWLEGRRLHEHLFQANLGTASAWAFGLGAAVAVLLEVLARILLPPLA